MGAGVTYSPGSKSERFTLSRASDLQGDRDSGSFRRPGLQNIGTARPAEIRLRSIRGFGSLLVLGMTGCVSAASRVSEPFAGCYRFSSALFFGTATPNSGQRPRVDSTRVLQLSADSVSGISRWGKPIRRPLAVATPTLKISSQIAADFASHSYWQRVGHDSLLISRGTMLSTHLFRLQVRGDSLVGVQTFSTDVFVGRTVDHGTHKHLFWADPTWTPVFAVRTSCGYAEGAPGSD